MLDGRVVAVTVGAADCETVGFTDGVMRQVGAVDGTKEGQKRGVRVAVGIDDGGLNDGDCEGVTNESKY